MEHRTAIITAASVAVVVAAATAAIATNLGILDSATSSSNVGALTVEATTTLAPTKTVVTEPAPTRVFAVDDTVLDDDAMEASEDIGELASFAIGDAGVVTLGNDGAMLTIADIETNPGWNTLQMLDGTSVDIGFMSQDGVALQFTAELDDTGHIVTAVNDLSEPETVVVTETVFEDGAPASSGSSGSSVASSNDDDGDDHGDDRDDGDDHGDDGGDDDEHEDHDDD